MNSHWHHIVSRSATIGVICAISLWTILGLVATTLTPQSASAQANAQVCDWYGYGEWEDSTAYTCYVYTKICNEGDFDVYFALAEPKKRLTRHKSIGWVGVKRNECSESIDLWSFGLVFIASKDGQTFNIGLDDSSVDLKYNHELLFSPGKGGSTDVYQANSFICIPEDLSVAFETSFDGGKFDDECDKGYVRTPLSHWVQPNQRDRGTYVDLKIRPNWSHARALSGYRALRKDGFHTITYDGGTKFEGYIKNDLANGHGVMTWADGNRYEGNWINGERTGHGVYTWGNGDRYEGNWLNGAMSGHGAINWANGKRYVGNWKDAKRNGRGVMVLANGDTCDGEWRDSQLVGTGMGVQGQISKTCYPQEYRFTFDPGKLIDVEAKEGHIAVVAEGNQAYKAKDFARARELYDQACKGGNTTGCFNAGFMYRNGVGGALDQKRARMLFDQACEDGVATACYSAGNMYRLGEGGMQDQRRARKLYDQACDGKGANGCANLGNMFNEGIGGAKDKARARELYSRACENGNTVGCFNAGNMLLLGEGGAQNEARARELYEQACEGGNAGGCNSSGNMFRDGEGGARDFVRARALYEQACQGGVSEGCYSASLMFGVGQGGTQDNARARALLERACDGGYAKAC
jgi:TPR repeat protein